MVVVKCRSLIFDRTAYLFYYLLHQAAFLTPLSLDSSQLQNGKTIPMSSGYYIDERNPQ